MATPLNDWEVKYQASMDAFGRAAAETKRDESRDLWRTVGEHGGGGIVELAFNVLVEVPVRLLLAIVDGI